MYGTLACLDLGLGKHENLCWHHLFHFSLFVTMTLENWQLDLQEQGYAIVPGILDPSECNTTLENGMELLASTNWRSLEKRGSKDMENHMRLSPMHGALTQHYSIGHRKYGMFVHMNE